MTSVLTKWRKNSDLQRSNYEADSKALKDVEA